MSIELSWDEHSDNVIRYDFPGQWDWQDFILAFNRTLEMARTLDGAHYDVIDDLLKSPHLPPGSGITHVYGVFKRKPANCGITVIVTRSAFVRALVEVLLKVHPDARHAFAITSTLEEARAIIAQMRKAANEPA